MDATSALASPHERPTRLVWADGTTYLRVQDVERYVRGVLEQRLDSSRIVARMREAGWDHRRAEARRPGAGQPRIASG
jgi:hypothetical protein